MDILTFWRHRLDCCQICLGVCSRLLGKFDAHVEPYFAASSQFLRSAGSRHYSVYGFILSWQPVFCIRAKTRNLDAIVCSTLFETIARVCKRTAVGAAYK
jgi:hypothetical protein